jgi:competence protein ComEC
MQRLLAGFCAGGVILAMPWRAPEALPQWLLWAALAALAGLVLASLVRRLPDRRWLLPCLGVCIGLAWSAWHHQRALSARIPEPAAGNAVGVIIRVMDDPQPVAVADGQPPAVRFQARVDGATGPGRRGLGGAVIRLSWYGAPQVGAGDRWEVQATLRRPWSFANAAGFDYERWLLGSEIQGTGYVRAGRLLARRSPGALARARQGLSRYVEDSGLAWRGVIQALMNGRTGGIDADQWDLFRATGTVHLMVISGLHVSLAALLGFAAASGICRVIPGLPLYFNAGLAGSVGGLLTAAGYVAIAGAGLPALRAWIMAAVVMLLAVWGRAGRFGGGLLLAFAGIVLAQPLAVHLAGFWLSFGAVAVLLLALGRRRARAAPLPAAGAVTRLLAAQLALSLGMLPLVAMHTGDLPWAGIAANLVAVPVVSVVVVPAVLAGASLTTLWPGGADLALLLADRALGWVMAWLAWLARAPPVPATAGTPALLMAQAAALCWLLRPPLRYLPPLALCGLLVVSHRPLGIPEGAFRVTALDVGQGDAVLVETRTRRLLFDAGPGFPGGFEAGSAVVVPVVAASGPPRVDTLILSHDDVDHTGGAAAVQERLAVGVVLNTSGSAAVPACHGARWTWDGVDFRVLSVPRPANASDNDRSCVLVVDDGRQRALLPGDIGAAVEPAVVRAAGGPVTLLLAPHHGSGSSSSRSFVRLMSPRLVFVSAARDNRYGHPHADVLSRYREVGARVFVTGAQGALTWESHRPAEVRAWRRDRAPYWRSQPQFGSAQARRRRVEAVDHVPQYPDQLVHLVVAEKAADLQTRGAAAQGYAFAVPGVGWRVHQESGEVARTAVLQVGVVHAAFEQQMFRREGQHLLEMGPSHAVIQARQQYGHLDDGEGQHQPQSLVGEHGGDRTGHGHQGANQQRVGAPGP